MKKFFGYLFLAFGMAFALSYFQNSSVNALDGSYDDAIMGQSSHIDQDENKIEDAKEENSYSLRTMIQNGWFYQGNKKCFRDFVIMMVMLLVKMLKRLLMFHNTMVILIGVK